MEEAGVIEETVGVYATSYGEHEQPGVSANGTTYNACESAGNCTTVFTTLGSAHGLFYEDDTASGLTHMVIA